MSEGYTASFEFEGMRELLAKRNLQTGGATQQYIDREVLRYDEPYMPFQTGALVESGVIHTKVGSGEVVYSTPYAHYLYVGKVMGPNIPIIKNGQIVGFFSPPQKHYTGKSIVYDTTHNPLAGSFWFERMKADHAQDILKGASKVAGSEHD